MIMPRMNLIGYDIASAKEYHRGSWPVLCTYVDVDRQGGNKLQTAMQSAFWLGWPYGPFLRDAPLPGFLYCLKYPGFGCLHSADRSLYDIISQALQRAEQTAPYAFKSLSKYFGVIQWSVLGFKSNERTNTCAYLHRFDRSHLLTRHDWSIM